MIFNRTNWVAGLLISLALANLRGATISWTNTSGGLWSAPSNWDTHLVPGVFDSANITAAGTYTVTVDTSVSILNLTLGGASGQQTLTNAAQTLSITNTLVTANGIFGFGGGTFSGGPLNNQGTFNWGGGTVAIPVTVAAVGTLSVNGAGVTLESALTNGGTIHWSGNGSSLTIYNNHAAYSGAIYNQAGALFDIQNDQAIYYTFGSELFENAGIVRKSAGTSTTSFNVAFTNAGTVDAQSGTIQFGNSGNIGGSYNTASGATIQFTSGSYTETGTVTNTGTGLFRQNGAMVTLNDRITRFILASGKVALSPTFQGSGAIQNLQLDGAYLTGTNRVSGTLGIDGGGMDSASPLTVTATGVLDFNGAAVTINSPLTNAGTVNWSGSSLTLENNTNLYTGAIYNQAGALFDIQNDQTVYITYGNGNEFFNNAGTVRKTAGLGVSTFNIVFTNTGTVDAQSGAIHFAGNGNIGGTYNTAAGAIIEFSSGSFIQSGTPSVTGSGLCRQNNANVTLSDRIPNFILAAGNVALSPNFQIDGAIHNLQLDGAYLTGANRVAGTLGFNGGGLAAASPPALPSASPLTVNPGGVLNFNGAAVTINSPLTNAGTVNWSGSSLTLENNTNLYTGAIYNQAGALFNIQNDQTIYINFGNGNEFFNNAGTLRKTAGLGISTFNIVFTNTGTVDAQSGAIHFAGGGNIGGTYNTAAGAIIEFSGGSFIQSGTPSVTGSGLCRQNNANVTLSDRIPNFILAAGNVALSPNFQIDGAIHNLQLDGAYLTGANRVAGTLGFNGGGLAAASPPALPFASPLTVTATGVLNFNGAAVTINAPLTNAGTINWSGGSLTVANNANASTGAIYNQAGGLFVLQSDQILYTATYGFELFNNAGTVRKTAGLGISSFNLAFANAGTLDAQSGTIKIAGPYTQTGGAMNFGITSLADFGKIAFAANAPLTGTLSVNFNDGYFPSAGDSFSLLTYTTPTGVFTNLALPSQAEWQTNYSASTFTLSVLSVTGAPPQSVTLTPLSLAAGNFTLRINGSVGPSYILQASTNLTIWTDLSTNTPSVMPFTVIDPNAGSFNHRFYRALLGP